MDEKFDEIDDIDLPRFSIVERCKDFLNDEHTRDRYCVKKKESTIKKQESELVTQILSDLASGNGLEELVEADCDNVLISTLCDFVSSKYALNHLYRKYKYGHPEYLSALGSAMTRAIEIIEDLTVGGALRSARKRLRVATLHVLLQTMDSYSAIVFQVDIKQMNASDMALCSCAAGSLSGRIRTLVGFIYMISEGSWC